jgi:hypothetical protein
MLFMKFLAAIRCRDGTRYQIFDSFRAEVKWKDSSQEIDPATEIQRRPLRRRAVPLPDSIASFNRLRSLRRSSWPRFSDRSGIDDGKHISLQLLEFSNAQVNYAKSAGIVVNRSN